MRLALILATCLTVALSSPNGYYHQEYNYKTSSSSFKNNELQHKTDDQGYYSKDGDLEGRIKPKVSSNSEHSEYINPKLQYGASGANAGYYDAESDLASHGNMLANSYGSSYGGSGSYHAGYGSEGVASSDYIGGALSSGSQYQSVNLRNIASRLQNDLGLELQSALVRPAYQVDINELEAELHRNLSSRLNAILQERFGAQTIRSGQSYSISHGQVQAVPNYQQSELDLLQRQVENSLLQELRQQYQRNSHSSQQTIHVATTTYRPNYDRYVSTSTYRPTSYRPIYPNINQIDNQDKYLTVYPAGTKNSYYNAQSNTNRVTYTQAENGISITDIASKVQNNLNNQLNRILEQAQERYFNENSGYTAYTTGPILENLKQELRQNLTFALDEELRRHFGTQYQRDGYMFTTGAVNQYNYNVADLENLRRQVEENLINKLIRDFEAARQHWITRQQTSSHSQQTYYGHGQTNEYSNYGTAGNIRYSTPRYLEDVSFSTPRYPAVDDYHRPTAASIVPLISSGIKNNQYQTISGSHVGGYETSSGVDSSNFARLQQQLQAELSRQLQGALSQTTAYYRTGGYTTTSGGRAAFDQAYNQLFDELQKNLTQQLQSYQSGSSSGYSTSYSGINDSQLAQLRSQLQSSLASQLQQGLQQSFSASASYSASSSSSSSGSGSGSYYRPVRGSADFYQYGQYKSGGGSYYGGEDCQGDDASQYRRVRRSYGGYRSRPLGLSTYSGTGYNAGGSYGRNYQTSSTYGQEPDDSETFIQTNQNLGQEIDDDDTQQIIEPIQTYGKHIGQEEDDSDNTQQVEVDNEFTSINLGSQNNGHHGMQLGQEDSDSESSLAGYRGMRKPITGYSHFEVGLQKPKPNNFETQLGQEEDDSESSSSSLLAGAHYGAHIPSVSQVSHFQVGLQKPKIGQEESTHYGSYGASRYQYNNLKPTYTNWQSNSHRTHQLGQEEDHSDDTQQVEQAAIGHTLSGSSSFGLNIQNQRKPTSANEYEIHLGQEEDNSDNTHQQIEVDSAVQPVLNLYHKPNPTYGSQLGQEVDTDDTQQIESHHDFESFNQLSQKTTPKSINVGQQVDDTDRVIIGQNADDLLNKPLDVGQVPETWDVLETGSQSTKKPLVYGTQNVLPESETVKPLHLPTPRYPNYSYFTSTTTKKPQNVLPENENVGVSESPSNTFYNYYSSSTTKKPHQYGTENEFDVRPSTPKIYTHYQKPSTNDQIDLENPRPTTSGVGNPFEIPTPTQFISPLLQSGNQHLLTDIKPKDFIPHISSVELPAQKPFGVPPSPPNEYQPSPRPIFGAPVPVYPGTSQDVPPVEVPLKLKEVSVDLQTELFKDIENIVNIELPSSHNPKKLYQETLQTLQENITVECQKLLKDTRYINLHIHQEDVVVLEQFLRYHLTRKLNEKFSSYLGYSIESETYFGRNYYGQNQQKPQISSNAFLNTEIQQNQYYPSGEFDVSLQNIPKSSTPLPTSELQPVAVINEAEREADLLLQSFSQAVQRRTNSSIINEVVHQNQPQNKIIKVKLENLTNKQVNIINNILEEFYVLVDEAVQTTKINLNVPYQESLEKLEKNIKINLSDCFTGKNIDKLKPYNLDKYYNIIISEFEPEKLANLQKYLEIKLIKRLRAQLKTVYNINTEEDGNVEFISHPLQPTINIQRVVVKLDHLTPTQYKIIMQIEEDFNHQIEAAVAEEIKHLRTMEISSYEYKESLDKLKLKIEQNITETIQKLCEPGFGQYSQIVTDNFDQSKISDLEKYLQIKLVNKLNEYIADESTSNSRVTHFHSSSSVQHHYGRGYSHSFIGQNSNGIDGPLKREENTYYHQSPAVPSTPYIRPTENRGVKGGSGQYIEPEAEIVQPEILSVTPVDETTTPKQGWWQSFSGRVKDSAKKLKQKIVGE